MYHNIFQGACQYKLGSGAKYILHVERCFWMSMSTETHYVCPNIGKHGTGSHVVIPFGIIYALQYQVARIYKDQFLLAFHYITSSVKAKTLARLRRAPNKNLFSIVVFFEYF